MPTDGYALTCNRFVSVMLGAMAAVTHPALAKAGEVRVEPFGQTTDGEQVTAYTLINASGASATILDYGGTIAAIRVPDRHGKLDNVVLAFPNLEDWETVGHANANIGRYANRIRGGFTLDGVHYPLNPGTNGITLHGGPPPYSKRIWKLLSTAKEGTPSVTLRLVSPDADQGFPGELVIDAKYTLTNTNELYLEFVATTGATTIVNLTNHIYFNLNGNGTTSVYGQHLRLAADRIAVKDEVGMPSGELRLVAGTELDLRDEAPVIQLVSGARNQVFAAPRVSANPPNPGQLANFDHSYVFPEGFGGLTEVAARLEDDTSGRTLELRTTEPSIQVYVPGRRAGVLAEGGGPLRLGPAIALETQHLPDSPNHREWPSTELRPGETYRTTTIWSFGVQTGD
ncbi:MAG TPA: aldose epimerase family protein [Sphingobium sp.]|nr:aldose epimerase family protein [Sphingobium sp.]